MYKYILLILSLAIIISCNEDKPKLSNQEVKEIQDEMIGAHKYILKRDKDLIKKYGERRNWKLEMTETGLFYDLYKKGEGKPAKAGDLVTINYTIKLLDGTYCYSSDSLGSKSFVIGNGSVVSGLDEGIKMLGVGDKGRFVMAPHLAHGTLGDDVKIPRLSIIVYHVELLSLED
jgi:FKBP-type peptidyl-prolyl cis-trans isomerase